MARADVFGRAAGAVQYQHECQLVNLRDLLPLTLTVWEMVGFASMTSLRGGRNRSLELSSDIT